MDVGKPLSYSIPFVYLVKSMEAKDYKGELKKFMMQRKVLVNNKSVITSKRFPLCVLDYITIGHDTHYQLFFVKESKSLVRPVLCPRSQKSLIFPVKKHYTSKDKTVTVQSFQGLNYMLKSPLESYDVLRSPFSFIIEDRSTKTYSVRDLRHMSHLIQAIKLTGPERFETFDIVSYELKDSLHHLRLRDNKTNKQKDLISSLSELRSKYVFIPKEEIVIND
jgi:ribosomal protein S4E